MILLDTTTQPEIQLKSAQQWKINGALTTDRNKKRIKLLQRSAPLSALLNRGHFGSKKLPHHRNKKTTVIITNTDVSELLLLWASSPLCPHTEPHPGPSLQPLPVDPGVWAGMLTPTNQSRRHLSLQWLACTSREWDFPYRNPSTTQTRWILITERVSEEKELMSCKEGRRAINSPY